MGHAGASSESPSEALWETLRQGLSRQISVKPDTGQGTCRAPAGHMYTPDTSEDLGVELFAHFRISRRVEIDTRSMVVIGNKVDQINGKSKMHMSCVRLFNRALNEQQLRKSSQLCDYRSSQRKSYQIPTEH